MTCEKCGSEEVYCGEHYSEEEGFGSVYLCKKCYPEMVRKYKNRYNSHVSKCNNFGCERCNGEGFRRKHINCEHDNIRVFKNDNYKLLVCEDCNNIIQEDSISNPKVKSR